MAPIDASHDPARHCWVESAADPGSDFPIQNLPYGRFRRADAADAADEPWRIGVAVGDQVLDLKLAVELCPWPDPVYALLQPLAAGNLVPLVGGPPAGRAQLRRALSEALTTGSDEEPWLQLCVLPQTAVELTLPCEVGDYTDFFSGVQHATAVGRLLRTEQPLTPNYKWVPIGYHGRASSVRASGHRVRRPNGQYRLDVPEPRFGPSRRLDFELEVAAVIGAGNRLGDPVDIVEAEHHIAGLLLLNDWSARDIQAWEHPPLGPFLAKSFMTSVSPWLVTLEALAPFRAPFARPAGDPPPLAYLDSAENRAAGHFDITLEAHLQTAAMREQALLPHRLAVSQFKDAYWTFAQMLAHHTVGGCNLRCGDLLGSGTQSGPGADGGGSLLELTQVGRRPLALPNGETRRFLEDGDSVTLRAHCRRDGYRRIGFGACEGTVMAARVPSAKRGGRLNAAAG